MRSRGDSPPRLLRTPESHRCGHGGPVEAARVPSLQERSAADAGVCAVLSVCIVCGYQFAAVWGFHVPLCDVDSAGNIFCCWLQYVAVTVL